MINAKKTEDLLLTILLYEEVNRTSNKSSKSDVEKLAIDVAEYSNDYISCGGDLADAINLSNSFGWHEHIIKTALESALVTACTTEDIHRYQHFETLFDYIVSSDNVDVDVIKRKFTSKSKSLRAGISTPDFHSKRLKPKACLMGVALSSEFPSRLFSSLYESIEIYHDRIIDDLKVFKDNFPGAYAQLKSAAIDKFYHDFYFAMEKSNFQKELVSFLELNVVCEESCKQLTESLAYGLLVPKNKLNDIDIVDSSIARLDSSKEYIEDFFAKDFSLNVYQCINTIDSIDVTDTSKLKRRLSDLKAELETRGISLSHILHASIYKIGYEEVCLSVAQNGPYWVEEENAMNYPVNASDNVVQNRENLYKVLSEFIISSAPSEAFSRIEFSDTTLAKIYSIRRENAILKRIKQSDVLGALLENGLGM